jgi:hypothetical protein
MTLIGVYRVICMQETQWMRHTPPHHHSHSSRELCHWASRPEASCCARVWNSLCSLRWSCRAGPARDEAGKGEGRSLSSYTTYLLGVLAAVVQNKQNLDLFTLTCQHANRGGGAESRAREGEGRAARRRGQCRARGHGRPGRRRTRASDRGERKGPRREGTRAALQRTGEKYHFE